MSTKQRLLHDPASCLNKAAPTEPVFLLRANDPCAAATVRLWAAMAHGLHEPDKVDEALEIAKNFDHWLTLPKQNLLRPDNTSIIDAMPGAVFQKYHELMAQSLRKS
jgi:hypothetical protein